MTSYQQIEANRRNALKTVNNHSTRVTPLTLSEVANSQDPLTAVGYYARSWLSYSDQGWPCGVRPMRKLVATIAVLGGF